MAWEDYHDAPGEEPWEQDMRRLHRELRFHYAAPPIEDIPQPFLQDGRRIQCVYCGSALEFVPDSSAFYNGRNYGPLWVCRPCRAWVGCHPNTTTPLGNVADAETRRWRSFVHSMFDPLWKRKMELDGCKKKTARTAAYTWLAKEMRLPVEDCHISLFNKDQCTEAARIVSASYTPEAVARASVHYGCHIPRGTAAKGE